MLRFLEKHPKYRPHFPHWTETEEYLSRLMMDPDKMKLTPVFIMKADELYELLDVNKRFLTVVTFVAPWSITCKTIMELTREFVVDPDLEHILFCEITVEDFPDVAQKFAIRNVPSILFFRDNQVCERLIGADVQDYTTKVMEHANNGPNYIGKPTRTIKTQTPLVGVTSSDSLLSHDGCIFPLHERLKELISQADIMVFMKGNAAKPRCGFSRQVVEILKEVGVPFETFDILEDEEVRQGLKVFSKWQTYPQVYAKGELIGGLDVIKELRDLGTLDEALGKIGDIALAHPVTEGVPS